MARFLLEAKTDKQIAYETGLSLDGIKVHMVWLRRKIGAPNRVAAALWAFQNKELIGTLEI